MYQIAFVFALLLMFAGTSLLAYNLMPEGRVASGRGLPSRRVDPAQVPSLIFRFAFPLIDRIAPFFSRIAWTGYRSRMSVELRRAGLGDAITMDHLLAMKLLTALVVPLAASRLMSIL